MPFPRIRIRLAAWNLLVLGMVLTATLSIAALSDVKAHEAVIDRELRLAAARAALRLDHDEEEREHHESEYGKNHEAHEARAEHGPPSPGETQGLFVIWATRGQRADAGGRGLPDGLPDNAALALALGGTEGFSDVSSAEGPIRVLSMPVFHDGVVVGAVQVAKPVRESRELLGRTLFILVATGAAGMVLAAVGSLFLAGRAMRPIEEAFERQRRFVADASHELRTPVAVVRARAEVLLGSMERLSPDAREEIERLHRDAEELSSLLTELLDLARLEGGEEAITLQPVALADVAEELAAQLEPLLSAKSVTMTVQPRPIWARTNLTRLRQVLRALVDNAMKHVKPGGHVRIGIDKEDGFARVQVEDDGEGIAPEHLPRVFDRFYRADPARARGEEGRRGGAGLGLSIAAELVRRMKGEIQISSEPGKGTVVTILLPLAGP